MLTISLATRTLRNVRDDRDGRTSQLRRETVPFAIGKTFRPLVNTQNKAVCLLPDRELPVISHGLTVPTVLELPVPNQRCSKPITLTPRDS